MSRTKKRSSTFSNTLNVPTRPNSVLNLIKKQTQEVWTSDISSDKFYTNAEKYFNDPVGFVREMFVWNRDNENEGPTSYQAEIMEALAERKRVCVRSLHGVGKSTLSSWCVWWFALTREGMMMDWKVPTTASAWRQLTKYLWPEIHKWEKKINWIKLGREPLRYKDELTSRSINLRYGQAFAVASNRAELIEGAHADHILYVFDESKVIPDPTWDSAEGALVNDEAHFLAVSTPGAPSGRFYEIQTKQPGYEDWWIKHVTLQDAITAGRVTPQWANDRLVQWGEKSAIYQNRVLGNFAAEEEDSLIPLHWVEMAVERFMQRMGDKVDVRDADMIGVDVARSGSDKTVIARRVGFTVMPLDKYYRQDTMQTTGLVVPYLRRSEEVKVNVDAVGVGAGVYDRLVEMFPARDNIYAFHPQTKTDYRDASELWEFADTYSAAWWNLRELLDPENPRRHKELLALPPDEDLPSELTKPKWRILSTGKIQVERKEEVKERLGRSPDCADAVVMACWDENAGGMEFA